MVNKLPLATKTWFGVAQENGDAHSGPLGLQIEAATVGSMIALMVSWLSSLVVGHSISFGQL
jgi:hypothetical protein